MTIKVFGVAGYTSHVVYDSGAGDTPPTTVGQGSTAIDVATGGRYKLTGGVWGPMGSSAVPVYDSIANFALVAASSSTAGVTYECIVPGADASDVGRAYWICMPISGVPAYAWRLIRAELSGLDNRRPSAASLANGATFVGAEYRATDTSATYVCKTAGAWRVRSANDCADHTGHEMLDWGAGHQCPVRVGATPVGGIGSGTVILFRAPAALPAAGEAIIYNGVAGGMTIRGECVVTGSGGAGTFGRFYVALGPWGWGGVALVGADYSALLGTDCGLALTFVDLGAGVTGCRYSFNGGAVAQVTVNNAVYTPPTPNVDPITIGCDPGRTLRCSPSIKAYLHTSTGLSDLQLGMASAATTSRVPYFGATIDLDWASPRIPDGVVDYYCPGAPGQRFFVCHSALNTVAPRKVSY